MKHTLLSATLLALLLPSTLAAAAPGDARDGAIPRVDLAEPTSGRAAERRVNLHANPVALLFQMLLVEAELRVRPDVSAGPMLSYVSYLGGEVAFLGVGAHALFTLGDRDVMDDAWIVHPYALATRGQVFGVGETGLELGAMGGYQWFWDSGFNLRAGAGLRYLLGIEGVEGGLFRPGGGVSVVTDLTLGYAF